MNQDPIIMEIIKTTGKVNSPSMEINEKKDKAYPYNLAIDEMKTRRGDAFKVK